MHVNIEQKRLKTINKASKNKHEYHFSPRFSLIVEKT